MAKMRLTFPTLVALVLVQSATAEDRIDFNRDVRPILSEHCFACHGPDASARKANLRLDTRDGATAKRRGTPAVVPGKAHESELVRRITAEDGRMPPPVKGKKLSAGQIEMLTRWVEEGAEYRGHWAFIAPTRPELPAVKDAPWPRNAIDRFVLARLEAEGIKPSPEADRITLIRRLTFDLTGLPPTPKEVDDFLADKQPDAYERLVNRLLASPRYGERMALEWLDAARYADTHGYHIDSGRDMTRWRDWVIGAFNKNKPFDQFTVEQIAGDLLPNPTTEQKIASGFNRNHMINYEGGAIPAEYLNAYIVDRVNTTATVWMGLTLACAQCHDHKFDPFTQKEYYQLYAFFHNLPENGLDGRAGNAPPLIRTPSREQRAKHDDLAAKVRDAERKLIDPHAEIDAAQAEWEAAAAKQRSVWKTVEPASMKSKGGANFTKGEDGSVTVGGPNPVTDVYTLVLKPEQDYVRAIRLEALADAALPGKGPGRSPNGNFILTSVQITTGEGKAEKKLKLRSVSADFSQPNFLAASLGTPKSAGWGIHPEFGKSHHAVFELAEAVRADGPLTVELRFESMYGQHQIARFRVSTTDAPTPHLADPVPATVRDGLAVRFDDRSNSQRAEIRDYYRSKMSPIVAKMNVALAALRKEIEDTEKQVPTTMVMKDMPKPRDTFVLVRGQYDKKGDKVQAATPAALPLLPKDAPPTRLGLAKWLVADDHPLTARVMVNRYWQMYFGTGLVKTSEDFGSQGDWPSHPHLLDWLAVEFRESGWDVKHMQRLIVMSAAYRQASVVPKDLLARDPENRLVGRMTRLRLQAEFLRDQALSVSGLLNGEIGGKSVSPYQPSGIWEELAYRADGKNFTAQEYAQSHGKDLYRRTMYTFWKRTAPPPSLITLDAPDREVCTIRRPRTNTPLQALVLMNDPTYVEASRKLAERMMTEGGASAEDRLTFAFRLVLARKPRDRELSVLKRVFDGQKAAYQRDPQAALKLLAVGEAKRDEKLDVAELAAYAMTASVILNLDEALTRN